MKNKAQYILPETDGWDDASKEHPKIVWFKRGILIACIPFCLLCFYFANEYIRIPIKETLVKTGALRVYQTTIVSWLVDDKYERDGPEIVYDQNGKEVIRIFHRARWGSSGSRIINTESDIPVLEELLENEDDFLAINAAHGLRRIGSEKATDVLIDALKYRDIRYRVAWALGELKCKKAVPALIDALDDDCYGKYAIAEALGLIGSKEAVPALIKTLDEKDNDFVLEKTIEALGLLGSADAVPKLILLLDDHRHHIRRDTCDALGKIGSMEAVPTLIKVLKDEDKYVRGAAADALGAIGSPDAIPALKYLSNNEPDRWNYINSIKAIDSINAKNEVDIQRYD